MEENKYRAARAAGGSAEGSSRLLGWQLGKKVGGAKADEEKGRHERTDDGENRRRTQGRSPVESPKATLRV